MKTKDPDIAEKIRETRTAAEQFYAEGDPIEAAILLIHATKVAVTAGRKQSAKMMLLRAATMVQATPAIRARAAEREDEDDDDTRSNPRRYYGRGLGSMHLTSNPRRTSRFRRNSAVSFEAIGPTTPLDDVYRAWLIARAHGATAADARLDEYLRTRGGNYWTHPPGGVDRVSLDPAMVRELVAAVHGGLASEDPTGALQVLYGKLAEPDNSIRYLYLNVLTSKDDAIGMRALRSVLHRVLAVREAQGDATAYTPEAVAFWSKAIAAHAAPIEPWLAEWTSTRHVDLRRARKEEGRFVLFGRNDAGQFAPMGTVETQAEADKAAREGFAVVFVPKGREAGTPPTRPGQFVGQVTRMITVTPDEDPTDKKKIRGTAAVPVAVRVNELKAMIATGDPKSPMVKAARGELASLRGKTGTTFVSRAFSPAPAKIEVPEWVWSGQRWVSGLEADAAMAANLASVGLTGDTGRPGSRSRFARTSDVRAPVAIGRKQARQEERAAEMAASLLTRDYDPADPQTEAEYARQMRDIARDIGKVDNEFIIARLDRLIRALRRFA